jgi:hypothetical protein
MRSPLEQNYYELLEVPRDATHAEIDRAYDRARAYYGEGSVAVYSLTSSDDLKLVQDRIDEAWLVLSDEKARAEYDARVGPPSPDERPLHREVRQAREKEAQRRPSEPVVAAVAAPPESPPIPAPSATPPPLPSAPAPALPAEPEPVWPPEPERQPPSLRPEPVVPRAPTPPLPRAPTPVLPVQAPPASPPPRTGLVFLPTPTTAPTPPRAGVAQKTPLPTKAPTPAPVQRVEPATPELPRPPELSSDAVFTGELLKRCREAAGLTVLVLADRTKIGRVHLENIEAEKFSALPPQVYLRGFLMSYARELKLDPLRVAKSYLELVQAKGGTGKTR